MFCLIGIPMFVDISGDVHVVIAQYVQASLGSSFCLPGNAGSVSLARSENRAVVLSLHLGRAKWA